MNTLVECYACGQIYEPCHAIKKRDYMNINDRPVLKTAYDFIHTGGCPMTYGRSNSNATTIYASDVKDLNPLSSHVKIYEWIAETAPGRKVLYLKLKENCAHWDGMIKEGK